MGGKLLKQKRLIYLLVAGILFVAGGGIAYLGNSTDDPLLILVGFAGLAGGVLLVMRWRREREIRVLGKDNNEVPNCLLISEGIVEYALLDEDKLLGLSHKNYNDGKYYHIHKVDKEGRHAHFELPDDDENERHYDPTEMANVVTMPSNKKYFTWSASLMQTISIGVMCLVVGGEIIGLVAMGG